MSNNSRGLAKRRSVKQNGKLKALNGNSGASQVTLLVKDLPTNAGDVRDVSSIPESGRSPWKRAWQPIPVFLPGESHGQRSQVGYSPWGHTELALTEATKSSTHSVLTLERKVVNILQM